MTIKGLENLVTIQGKNGEIRQGMIEWIPNTDEFWFSENGRIGQRMWGKLDYWEIKGYGVGFGKIFVTEQAEKSLQTLAEDMAMINNLPVDECMSKLEAALSPGLDSITTAWGELLAQYDFKLSRWERVKAWIRNIFTKE